MAWRDIDEEYQDDLGGVCITATARVGNNASGGYWEYAINGSVGNMTWFHNNQELSAELEFMLNVEPFGGEDSLGWVIGENASLEAGDKTYDYVTKVAAQAIASPGTSTDIQIILKNLIATFYDSDFNPTAISASKDVGQIARKKDPDKEPDEWETSAPVKEKDAKNIITDVAQVVDAPEDSIRVVVTGTVKLVRPNGASLPDKNQLIGNIFVWTEPCDDA
jgi:hypothetical protein